MRSLQTHSTQWDPNSVSVSLNVAVDGCIVPSESSPEGARLSESHIIVLDNFLDGDLTEQLLEVLGVTEPSALPPASHWERQTADTAEYSQHMTFGVKDSIIKGMMDRPAPAILEVQSRVYKLYEKDFHIAHLPSDAIQQPPQTRADCSAILANCAVRGDEYGWHVDADPTSFPNDSAWVSTFGDYFNGEPGKPLLVSLLLYLIPPGGWPVTYGADTLFLDSGGSDAGIFVRPKRNRAVLMQQDVLHKVSSPSAAAGGLPRYSLVWKLAWMRKEDSSHGDDTSLNKGSGTLSISKSEWGRASTFGSTARVHAVLQALQHSRKHV